MTFSQMPYQRLDTEELKKEMEELTARFKAAESYTQARVQFMEKEALEPARKAVQGIFDRLGEDEKGLLIGNVCVGTGVGDYPFYCARPTSTNDLHGVGAFLLMCAEAAKAL